MSQTVIIFGGTGQLALNRLLPALARTESCERATIIAVGRTPYSSEEYRALLPTPEDISPERWSAFVHALTYHQADPTDTAGYTSLANRVGSGDRLLYLAVPPTATAEALTALEQAGLHKTEDGTVRIVMEKPFGTDVASAEALQAQLLGLFPEDAIYPIDHYLAKETVENLLAFRFGNALFEPLWNAEYIKEIQVTVAEVEGVEDRLSSYAGIGAVKDLLQNHALQLVALIAMEEPADKEAGLAQAKHAVVQQLHGAPELTVLGQYKAAEEVAAVLGTTETFAATVLHIDNPRWHGVPFAIRVGKCMPQDVAEITVTFRPCASGLFGMKGHANTLTFRIQPDESIFLSLAVKEPGAQFKLATARMTFCYRDTFQQDLPDAYTAVLEAVAQGDHSVAVRMDSICAAWRLIEELKVPSLPVHRYEPGTWGPSVADELMVKRDSDWIVTDHKVCNGVTLHS